MAYMAINDHSKYPIIVFDHLVMIFMHHTLFFVSYTTQKQTQQNDLLCKDKNVIIIVCFCIVSYHIIIMFVCINISILHTICQVFMILFVHFIILLICFHSFDFCFVYVYVHEHQQTQVLVFSFCFVFVLFMSCYVSLGISIVLLLRTKYIQIIIVMFVCITVIQVFYCILEIIVCIWVAFGFYKSLFSLKFFLFSFHFEICLIFSFFE